MKILNWLVIVVFSLSLSFLGGCANKGRMKTGGKGGVAGGYDETQTAGLSEEEGFSEYGASQANRMKASYNQTYYFDYDCFRVKEDDIESIKVQADYLASHAKAKVRLEGHTDLRGSREYNVALGWKRAKAVANILRRYGIADDQLALVSYGKEKPVAFGHNESCHSLNRRVNLVYESQ